MNNVRLRVGVLICTVDSPGTFETLLSGRLTQFLDFGCRNRSGIRLSCLLPGLKLCGLAGNANGQSGQIGSRGKDFWCGCGRIADILLCILLVLISVIDFPGNWVTGSWAWMLGTVVVN